MILSKESKIGEVVAASYRSASVFQKNGIDFCCNGNRSIAEACGQDPAKAEQLILELEKALVQENEAAPQFNNWPIDLLADYIEKKHHRYVELKIQEILPYLEKIVRVHGGRHPELSEVQQLFKETAGELTAHMKKEELILFPFIRKMAKAQIDGTPARAPFGTVQNPIRMMMHEHDIEGERFRKISALTNTYTPPADACNTYTVTLALLKEFEEDLHLHIHLENNILFPKAMAMEASFETAH